MWESLADELRNTHDVQRTRELVMLLEEAIFNRQQELVLNVGQIDKQAIEEEEQALRQVLRDEIMLIQHQEQLYRRTEHHSLADERGHAARRFRLWEIRTELRRFRTRESATGPSGAL